MTKPIFALDIGTRSVTGIILRKDAEKYSVIDHYIREHDERSMLDGQIHDVVAVARIVKDVKEALEHRHGPLHEVSVAAAGRALKTVSETQSMALSQPITNQEQIKFLELDAVQKAQASLARAHNGHNYDNYYCVGYSVLKYTLDGTVIGSLIDQNGDHATVEIIATFLPKVVVESLIATLKRADLAMKALTLEPIAAIQVLIPESMRRLNVALIDIGAGTSDIALTKQGTIAAFGMVPVAGDEITEAVSDHYLLDFPQAEETKRQIVNHGEATVNDILGFETSITYDSLFENVNKSIHKLAHVLATEIIELNHKAPQAVMLIGGGSLTPEITKLLSEKLHLPENRVAVRGIEAIQNLHKPKALPIGPDFITPIGIAIAANQNPIHYMSITINGHIIRMFEMKELTVGDCLIQAGIDLKKYYGKPGLASMITVNHKPITLPGAYGKPPIITVNNKPSHVDAIVNQYDDINISKGQDGHTAHVSIETLLDEIPKMRLRFNNQTYHLEPQFYVNDVLKDTHYIIQDKDDIRMRQAKTIQDFFSDFSIEHKQHAFVVFVNHQQVELPHGKTQLLRNGQPAMLNDRLEHDDRIQLSIAHEQTVKDLLQHMDKDYWTSINVTFNKQPIQLKKQNIIITRNQEEMTPDTMLSNNDQLYIQDKQTEPFIFQDIFRYIDLDLTQMSGQFQLYKNNEVTAFHDQIHSGDQLSIR